jgi:hypothetical protein
MSASERQLGRGFRERIAAALPAGIVVIDAAGGSPVAAVALAAAVPLAVRVVSCR